MRLTAAGVSEVAEAHDTRAAGRGLGRAKPAAAAAAGPAPGGTPAPAAPRRVLIGRGGVEDGLEEVDQEVQDRCEEVHDRVHAEAPGRLHDFACRSSGERVEV